MAALLLGFCQVAAQVVDRDKLRQLLDYDRNKPLDVVQTRVFERAGATVHDITYASPIKGRVTAYLVIPTENGPHAGMVYGHWGEGNRTEFLSEAILLARLGAVSILIDYPWERPRPWWEPIPRAAEPEKRLDLYVRAIVDLRRAFDVLLSQPGVDSNRIGYAGHSFGAQWGAILCDIDKRMFTAVLIAGIADTRSFYLGLDDDPGWSDYRKTMPEGQLERFIEMHSILDPIVYVAYAKPVSLFFQFARHDKLIKEKDSQRYFDAASEPKSVCWYDGNHEMQNLESIIDRLTWLQDKLALKPLDSASTKMTRIK